MMGFFGLGKKKKEASARPEFTGGKKEAMAVALSAQLTKAEPGSAETNGTNGTHESGTSDAGGLAGAEAEAGEEATKDFAVARHESGGMRKSRKSVPAAAASATNCTNDEAGTESSATRKEDFEAATATPVGGRGDFSVGRHASGGMRKSRKTNVTFTASVTAGAASIGGGDDGRFNVAKHDSGGLNLVRSGASTATSTLST